MEKLEPIIKHRFWILLAIVPIVAIFGYYQANAALNDARRDREKKLNEVFDAVPTGNEANPKWTKAEYGGIEIQNANFRSGLDEQIVRIWEDQQARMTWPAGMQPYLPEEGYRGDFERKAGFVYRDAYSDLIRELHAFAEPIEPAGAGIRGKVFLGADVLPRHSFISQAVRSEDIWNAHEDTWFLRLLLEAVRNVNQSAPNAAKSVVRKISEIRLVGGTGETSSKKSGTRGADTTLMMNLGQDDPGREAYEAGNVNGQRGARTTGGSVAFGPAEEFGPELVTASSRSTATDADDADATTTAPAGNTRRGRELLRYIKLDENARFRERGFYMSVIIDQTKIADFLVELSNADWPIRIARFHVGPNPESGSGMSGSRLGSPLAASAFADPGEMETSFAPMRLGADFNEDAFAPDAAAYGPSPLVSGDELAGLLGHHDLVQLVVAGAITFYNPPPTDVLASVLGTSEEDAASTDENETAGATDTAADTNPAPPETPAVDDQASLETPEPPAETTDDSTDSSATEEDETPEEEDSPET